MILSKKSEQKRLCEHVETMKVQQKGTPETP